MFLFLAFSLLSLCFTARAQDSSALSPTELRGKKVFLQRCSICHLPPLYEPPEVKPYGPVLTGYLRNSQMEARARKDINEGTPRMPGFQYGLQPGEIDDVIAYLKTMKAAPADSKGGAPKSEGGSNASTGRTGD
jgi:mono/diheme cytochrome c family protein